MADSEKLWFELGVRDYVSKTLDNLIGKSSRLQKSLIGASKDLGFKNAYQNAEQMETAMSKIDRALKRIKETKLTITDPDELDRFEKVEKKLKAMKRELKGLWRDIKNQPDPMNNGLEVKGLVDSWTKRLGLNLAITQVNELLGDNKTKQNQAAQAARENAQANQRLVNAYDRVVESGKRTNTLFDQVKAQMASTVSLYAMQGLLKSVIQVGGEFEVQHIALKSILGDLEQANTMFNEIKQLAVVSPFNFSQLIAYSKQIAAFGIPYEEMYDTTKRLADMSAGLGVDMSRLILAYGQVRSAAVLRGQELRQFTEAGIPMVQALADEFTRLNGRLTTTGEVFELISKRAVPFEMVKKVLWDMTNEGGRFFNMQFTLSDTLAGKWSNLEDAWQIMLSEFAKGESLGGRVLKTFVQGLTDLIESLDKIGPLIGGLGMARLGRYVQNGFSSFLGKDIANNITKAQQLHAIELKRRYINMEITQEQYNQGMALNRNRDKFYTLLAQEGRLKEYQIARAIQQKKINTEKLHERVINQEITMREAAQLRLWRMKYAQASIFNLKLKEIGLSLKTMMGPFGWISLAIDGLVWATTSWYLKNEQILDQMKEASDNFANSAKDREREINDALSGYKDKSPSNDSEYKSAIDAMKEQLKQYDANYNSIMREVDSLESLQEKYKLLKEELAYVAESYKLAANNKAEFDKLQEDTSGLAESTKNWATANNYLNRSLNVVAAEGGKSIERVIDALAVNIPKLQSFLYDKDFNRRITRDILRDYADSLSFEEISDIRRGLQGYSSGGYNSAAVKEYKSLFEYMDAADKEKFDEYLKNAQKRNLQYDKEIGGEILKIVDSTYTQVAAELGTSADALRKKVEKEGNNLDQRTKTMLRDYFNQQMSAITNGNQALMQWVDSQRWTLFFHYDIVTDYTEKTAGLQGIAGTAWGRLNSGGGPVANPKGHTGFTEKDLKDAFGPSGNDVNNAKKVLSQRLHEQENLVIAMKTTKDATEEQKEEVKKLFDAMEADWNQMFTDDWRNLNSKGNPKPTKESKKDADLEAMKNRIDLYKKFYQELQGYKDIYGKAGALETLKKDGEFGKVFDWKKTYNISDLTNYKQTLDQLTKGFNANTEARQKLIDQTKADIENKQRKDAVENIKAYVSELKQMMSVMAENYDTYKKWVDLTGDADLAARVAGVTQNTSYSDYLRSLMKKQLDKTNLALTPDDVFGLDKTGIMNLGKDSVFSELWEEWRKNQQKLKKEQLDLYEDAIKNSKSYEDKIADVNRQLKKQIEAYEQLARSDEEREKLTANATKNANKEISKIKWEQFKDENDWGEIFGDIENVSVKKLEKLIKAMKDLRENTHLNVTETKAWHEGMNKAIDTMTKSDSVGSITEAIKNYKYAIKEYNALEAKGEGVRRGYYKDEFPDEESYKSALKAAAEGIDSTRKAIVKAISALAKDIQKLGNVFDSLGKTVGGGFGDILGGFGAVFDGLGKSIEAAASINTEAEGISGLINKVGAVVTVFNAMVEMNQKLDSLLPDNYSRYEKYAEKAREVNKLREAVDEYSIAVAEANAKEKEWFAGNSLSALRSNGEKAKKTLESYYSELYEAQEAYQDKGSGLSKWAVPIAAGIVTVIAGALSAGSGAAIAFAALGSAITGGLATGAAAAAIGGLIAAGVGTAVGQIAQSVVSGITYKDGQIDARNNMRIQTQHSSFWRGEKTKNLEEWVRDELNAELFDSEGLVNLEAAQEVLDKYGHKLVGDTKETLERLVELRKEYDEFIQQIEDYVGDIGTSLADNMTNAIWDWLSSGEDALDKFKEYASDTWKSIAQDIVKTFVKIAVLDKYSDTFKELFKGWSLGQYDDNQLIASVSVLAGSITKDFESALPLAEQIATTLNDAFKAQGFDITNQSSSSSTGSSIKNVSEQTADILAGYVDAIRADVSVNRVTQTQILLAVQNLSEMPTIARAQLTQLQTIAGNTGRNVELVNQIFEILHSAQAGTRRLEVQVYGR